jgi:hypothetical protein
MVIPLMSYKQLKKNNYKKVKEKLYENFMRIITFKYFAFKLLIKK